RLGADVGYDLVRAALWRGNRSTVRRLRRAADHLQEVKRMLCGRKPDEVDRIARIDHGLRIAEELPVERRSCRNSRRGEPAVHLRRKGGGVDEQLRVVAARIGERSGTHFGGGNHREEHRTPEGALRMPEKMHGAGIDAAVCAEIQARQSSLEGYEVRDRFADIVARGEKARQVEGG